MYQLSTNKYNFSNEKIGIENYKHDYPEIEHVANMLLENTESSRYTERIREKANKDKKIRLIKNEFADSVEIVDYNNKFLKAKVNYYVGKYKYNLILDMKTVTKGKVFLNKYSLLRQKNILGSE
jgi:hypothetical protein